MKHNHYKFIKFLTKKEEFSDKDTQMYYQRVSGYADNLDRLSRILLGQISGFDVFSNKRSVQTKLASASNQLAYRIWSDVLEAPNLQAAARIYSFWVDVAIQAGKNKNLDVENNIYNALTNIKIDRIFGADKDGYQLLPHRIQQTIRQLAQRYDPNGNYATLRNLLSKSSDYFSPFFLLAKDIEHVDNLSTPHERQVLNALEHYQNQSASLAAERGGHSPDEFYWLDIPESNKQTPHYFRQLSRALKPVKHKGEYVAVSMPELIPYKPTPDCKNDLLFRDESLSDQVQRSRSYAIDLCC
ncbi:RasGEF domain protein [Piscirickettsia salmonis]|uniref:RasGEF domain-containing protein n=1 Tax=Piscirickettsia salmonis TaxID=1238 RepID=UPI0012BABC45|nr:RasGEF domain-containing protein [Piscirickettsia salmonis]QGP54737.1 RasGEF domain protein [Piscirickettsia salmonis]QGP59366.1 RasGEF domain protein [Piscirickettsia salmonis]QGP64070.1 RasGEF domain protein [Piscirickettsia salmonis]